MSTASAVPTKLSDFTDIRREATRPPEFRDAKFADEFDDDTLFFECFRRADGKVALLGPPLFNLAEGVKNAILSDSSGSTAYPFIVRQLDRHSQIIADVPKNESVLLFTLGQSKTQITIQPCETELFSGCRVLFTLSKNNDLDWIKDWIKFARDAHGADAVLFYDNKSDAYAIERVEETIGSIEGLRSYQIVNWPFKYGPQGLDHKRYWDSDFCQLGAWEHARWRYLNSARSAQNSDVDELVLPLNNQSVFEAAEKDPFGIVRYRGRWVVGAGKKEISRTRRHADYTTVMRKQTGFKLGCIPYDKMGSLPKWTIVPGKCPEKAQWSVHRILNWWPSIRTNGNFSYRHFREINSNWKYDRSTLIEFDPSIHEEDDLLASYFEKSAL
ncbi:hypothetical protein ABLO27_10995 [Roseibium sp. SCPC15]|uniref:hypothetical protein n=1 Tax=Roseibium sp. SCP15 TaxID=3141376 RepID=UPI00333563CA